MNDVAVSDGAKGCERAALMYKCNENIKNEVRNISLLQNAKYNYCEPANLNILKKI